VARTARESRSGPAGHLPPLVERDLPDPLPLRALLGPGVIGAGVGLSSGEFILWPFIASQVGLVFLWAAALGIITQFFLNMEIERYTLATGETALTGFSRSWRHWGLFFAILVYFANLWPGWITSSATLLTFLVGGSKNLYAVLGLVAIGLALTITPVVYQALEKIEFLKVAVVLLFLVVAIAFAITAEAWADLPQAVTNIGRVPGAELGWALVLGALAFAGAGGGQNLVQSNWIRDKGFGMGKYIPRLVSPITGKEEAAPEATGFIMRDDEANVARWKVWWKTANTEQLVSFVAISFTTIVFMSMLAYSTVFGADAEQNVSFLQLEGEALKETVGPWFGTLFWIIGSFSLFAAALGIVDYPSRLAADVLKTSYLRDHGWSESKLYFALVWGLIVIGSVIVLTITSQPLVLLIISSCVGGFMMFIYSALLLVTNRKLLPPSIRISGVRVGAMIWSFLFFGVFSAIAIWDQRDNLSKLLGG
jgi:hypothetical protein